MLTHGVFGVVPRLRRSLPRCAKRGNVSFPAGPRPSCARERTKRPPTKPIASRRRIRPPKLPAHSKPRRGDTTSARIHIVNTQERTRASGLPAPSEPRRGGTTPKNPGREPGDKPHPKTNPSLGEAAQSPRRVSAFSIRAGTRRRLLLSPQKTRPRGKTLRGRVFSARVFQDATAGGFPLPPLCGRAPELPGRGPRPRRERRLPPRNSRPALPSRFSFRAPSP